MKRLQLIIGLLAVVSLFGCAHYTADSGIRRSDQQESFLMRRLMKVKPVNDASTKTSRDFNGIIYVLGGSQQDLEGRFKKAAALYKAGAAGKVLIMHRPGNTEYSPPLRRNLTNDEWSTDRLISLGLKRNDLEFVSVPGSFWGTYHEAKTVSDLAVKRGYRYLVLVSSSYHTRRVWDSFSKMLQDRNVDLYVYGSDDDVDFSGRIVEYFKLFTYDNLLLPFTNNSKSAD